MRSLVVTARPKLGASEPDSAASALRELGCEVVVVGYDLDELPDSIEVIRPGVVVVDAGAHLDRMCGSCYPTQFIGDCLRGRKLLPEFIQFEIPWK